jgi:hypothetical protein
VDATKRFAADEALQAFDAEGKLAERQRPLGGQAARAEALEVLGKVVLRPVDDPEVRLAVSVTSTARNGVARRISGSVPQTLARVSICHTWSRSTWTPAAEARRWKGASFRSASDSTGQQ